MHNCLHVWGKSMVSSSRSHQSIQTSQHRPNHALNWTGITVGSQDLEVYVLFKKIILQLLRGITQIKTTTLVIYHPLPCLFDQTWCYPLFGPGSICIVDLSLSFCKGVLRDTFTERQSLSCSSEVRWVDFLRLQLRESMDGQAFSEPTWDWLFLQHLALLWGQYRHKSSSKRHTYKSPV